MSPAAKPPDAEAPAATVGQLPVGTAGVLEMLRGLGTSGVVVGVLWVALTDRMDDIETRVERAQADTSADIAALAIKIDGLAVQVQAMQVEAARREGSR